jgi:hypothetical protein
VVPRGENAPAHDIRAGLPQGGGHSGYPVLTGVHVVVGEGHDAAPGLRDAGVASMAQPLLRLEEIAHADPCGGGEGVDHAAGRIGRVVVDDHQLPRKVGRRDLDIEGSEGEAE